MKLACMFCTVFVVYSIQILPVSLRLGSVTRLYLAGISRKKTMLYVSRLRSEIFKERKRRKRFVYKLKVILRNGTDFGEYWVINWLHTITMRVFHYLHRNENTITTTVRSTEVAPNWPVSDVVYSLFIVLCLFLWYPLVLCIQVGKSLCTEFHVLTLFL